MMTQTNKIAVMIAATALICSAASAQGDAEKGKDKAYTCTGCHGITSYFNAYPAYHVPKIAGQNYQYLVNALKGYKSGERKHPTMVMQAGTLSDQDIEDIAAYLANYEKGE